MMEDRLTSRLVCRGCGREIEPDAGAPFRCPAAGEDDIDHLLRKVVDPADAGVRRQLAEAVESTAGRPFADYRRFSHVYHRARQAGMSDAGYLEVVERLDRAVEAVDGTGFRTTPFSPAPDLSRRLGLDPATPILVTGTAIGKRGPFLFLPTGIFGH